jgi:hypothetical protein
MHYAGGKQTDMDVMKLSVILKWLRVETVTFLATVNNPVEMCYNKARG